jgi:hypothetical protein
VVDVTEYQKYGLFHDKIPVGIPEFADDKSYNAYIKTLERYTKWADEDNEKGEGAAGGRAMNLNYLLAAKGITADKILVMQHTRKDLPAMRHLMWLAGGTMQSIRAMGGTNASSAAILRNFGFQFWKLSLQIWKRMR